VTTPPHAWISTTQFSRTDCFSVDPALGGQAKIDADGYIAGAPELAAEIASSSVSIDLGPKKTAYRRNGVREYVVWRVLDEALDWFILRASEYETLVPGADGILRSKCFPGLWLDAAALVRGDLQRVHAVLHDGLKSAAHQAFVRELQARGAV
jgi:Uma2 family endonuclease